MPKKPPRNAFYFFMVDFKEEQRKKGINYNNMNEVALAAGPEWTNAPPKIRAKFEARAKAEKEKNNVPERKFTSSGISFAEIEAAEREAREAVEAERRDIANYVKQKRINNSILEEGIYLMDVNSYCKAGTNYLIGEMTLLRFSLRDGIIDVYHEIINPGRIPIGYALDVKQGSKELGLPMPDETVKRCDYINVLANLVDYLRRSAPHPAPLPPLYTMPEKVAECTDFIQQLCNHAAEDDGLFRVYRLDWLYYHLIQAISETTQEAFAKESLALQQLKVDKFKYNPGLACKVHEEADKTVECSSARVKRWAFTVLDTSCARLKIRPLPARHVPADFHIPSIEGYYEQRRGRTRLPADAPPSSQPSFDTSDTMSSLDCSNSSVGAGAGASAVAGVGASSADSSASTAGTGSVRRKHVPLRLPKTNLTMGVRAAPDLSTEEFPPLGASRGRGRGLLSSLDKMHI